MTQYCHNNHSILAGYFAHMQLEGEPKYFREQAMCLLRVFNPNGKSHTVSCVESNKFLDVKASLKGAKMLNRLFRN